MKTATLCGVAVFFRPNAAVFVCYFCVVFPRRIPASYSRVVRHRAFAPLARVWQFRHCHGFVKERR
ncbi:hypothetical protein PNO31109_03263 [Pandoraea nosoerga]|uniref:Uncharacterized protein n=1 Tax=Pandoraea nosoerga TaxID=2508296 RepID=A0A5E4WKQ8_9BURK|nr:hypothetical protein PNO31109_03263 [Pandoraea nosoerga]